MLLTAKKKHQANKILITNWIGGGDSRELNAISQTACACSFVLFLDRKEPR